MRRSAKLAVFSVLLGVAAACQSQPSAVVSSGLLVSPELEELRPSQIAILPIDDGTTGGTFAGLAANTRTGVEVELARRSYAPLAPSYVDGKLQAMGRVGTGSAVRADWLGDLRNAFQEDAVLGLRMVEWDDRRVVETRRVRFAVEVLMLASSDGIVLWSGRLEGDVKAGGEGPSPFSREQRVESAAREVGRLLAEQLPERRQR